MRLVLRGPDNETREVELSTARVHIGRAYDNTIVLAENTVSRHHCSFYLDEQGQAIVEDLESRYGTFVAGEAVKGTAIVAPGQAVAVGEWNIALQDDKAGDSTDTTLEALSLEEQEEPDPQGPTRKTRLLDPTETTAQTTSSGYLALLLTLAALGAMLLAYVVVSSAGG